MKIRILAVIILFHLVLSVVTASAEPHMIMPWRGNYPAALSLTFDDGDTSQYTFVLPAINQRGFKSTFFVFTDLADYLNAWDWWKEATDKGHEIASHSKTHPYLTALPLSEAEFEIATSQTLIDQKIAGQKTVTFAYPYSDLNTEVKALVKKYYIGARGVGGALNNASTDNYNVASYDVANYTVSQMEDLTVQAVSQKKWLIPCFHSFDPGEYGGWSREEFLTYLDYLRGRTDLWIAPFGTVIKYVRERGTATLGVVTQTNDTITLSLADTLDDTVFDYPLTVRSEVPVSWNSVKMQQGATVTTLVPVTEESIRVVYFDAVPDRGNITLSVIPDNQVPSASNDSYSMTQSTAFTAAEPGVLSNDTGTEGATLTAQLVTGPSNGTLVLNSNGSFTYTPVVGYVGSDSFTYRASDGTLYSGNATVIITITSTGSVLFTDDFTRSPPVSLSPWTSVMGTWEVVSGILNGSGTAMTYSHIYYAPNPLWDNYAVEGRFKYASSAFGGGIGCRLNPATGAHYAAWIYLSESGHNVLVMGKMWDWTTYSGTPMAEVKLTSVGTGWHTLKMVCNGNRIQVYYDGTLKIDVTDNNYDSRAPYLSGGVGMAMFALNNVNTMSVDNVVVSTLSPVAVNDAYSTSQNTTLTTTAPGVLSNDTDPKAAALTAQLVAGPTHGVLTLNGNGSFTYTPTAGYVGSDSFTYRASDGTLTSGNATAAIAITSTGSVLFTDDFTRSVNPPAPLSPWTSVMGTWEVASGVLNGSGAVSSYSHIYYAPDPLWENYSVEARLRYASTAFGGGIGCRLNPATGAHYTAWIFPDNSVAGSNVLALGKMWSWTTYGGTPMGLVNLPSVGTGWHTLKMVCNGNRIQVYYDGTLKIDVTDNNYDSRAAYLSGGISGDMWTYTTPYVMELDTVVVNSLTGNQSAPGGGE